MVCFCVDAKRSAARVEVVSDFSEYCTVLHLYMFMFY